ncbi:MAG: hypothetical protein H8D23_11110 [Candidatus Brocadiales bacterium]|nr:hypothetical protein [Candidatus Brocadiales bacterium]
MTNKENLPALPTSVTDLAFDNDDLLSVAVAKAEGRLTVMDRELKKARKEATADTKKNYKAFYDAVRGLMKQHEKDPTPNVAIEKELVAQGYEPIQNNNRGWNESSNSFSNNTPWNGHVEQSATQTNSKKKSKFEVLDFVKVTLYVEYGQNDDERQIHVHDQVLGEFVVTEHNPYPMIPSHLLVDSSLQVSGYTIATNQTEIKDLPTAIFDLIAAQNKIQAKIEELDTRSMEVRHELQNMTSYERAARASLAEATIKRQEGGEEYLRLMEDTNLFGELAQLEASVSTTVAEDADVQ